MKNTIRKLAVPSAWRTALLVLWCLWFYILLVTPFAVMSVESPPFLTPAYAYLAVGMAMGVACAYWVEWRVPYRPSRRIVRCLIVMSVLVTLALVVPEWYSFLVGSVLGADPYSSTWLDVPVFGSALKFMSSLDDGYAFLYEFVLAVDGIFCAFAGSRLFSGEENASVPDRRKSRDCELRWGLFFLWAVLSLMFLLGVFRAIRSWSILRKPFPLTSTWHAMRGTKTPKTSQYKGGDERSIVCVTCTFRNKGNDEGAVFVNSMQLVPPEKNCAWELDDELWAAAYPQIADEMSAAFSLMKNTSFTCQIPFTLEKRADYFDDYSHTGRVPVTDEHYSLLVANAPVESWIDITL